MPGVSSLVRDSNGDYNFVFKNQLGDMSVVKIGSYNSAKEFMTDMAQGNVAQYYDDQVAKLRASMSDPNINVDDTTQAWAADLLYSDDRAKVVSALQSSNEFVVGGRTIVNAGQASVADAIAGGEGFDATATRLGIEDAIGLLIA